MNGSSTQRNPFTPATGLAVLLRHLRTFLAYELRDRNVSPEGKPASVTYVTTKGDRRAA